MSNYIPSDDYQLGPKPEQKIKIDRKPLLDALLKMKVGQSIFVPPDQGKHFSVMLSVNIFAKSVREKKSIQQFKFVTKKDKEKEGCRVWRVE